MLRVSQQPNMRVNLTGALVAPLAVALSSSLPRQAARRTPAAREARRQVTRGVSRTPRAMTMRFAVAFIAVALAIPHHASPPSAGDNSTKSARSPLTKRELEAFRGYIASLASASPEDPPFDPDALPPGST